MNAQNSQTWNGNGDAAVKPIQVCTCARYRKRIELREQSGHTDENENVDVDGPKSMRGNRMTPSLAIDG